MFDPRNNLANEVSAQLITHFGDKVFRTVIPRNIRLAEAPSFGKPALFHDKESRGALAYLALAGEMIRREEESSGVVRSLTAMAPGAAPAEAPPAPAAPTVDAATASGTAASGTEARPEGDAEIATPVSPAPAPQAEDRSR
jgi:hypothetical protein